MMTMSGSVVMPQQQQQQQHHHHQTERSKPEDAALHITVSDPVQHADGLNKYTSYRVDVRPPTMSPQTTTTTTTPHHQHMMPSHNNYQGGGGEVILPAAAAAAAGVVGPGGTILTYSSVLRRYSDFLWLYERLQIERAGSIVPPIPEKQPVGRFSPAFVEDRRIGLERFLRRVSVHPELADSSCLDTFLRADDVTFQAAKNIKGSGGTTNTVLGASQITMHQHHPGGMTMMGGGPGGSIIPGTSLSSTSSGVKKDGFKRWFAEAKTSMTGDLVKSPDDDLFEEIARYIHGLDNQMRNVSTQASGLVRKGKEIANGLFEFGLAFNLLGQSEADALGDALSKMGETADKLSVLSAEHAEKEMSQFEEPLQDYIKMIHAVKMALQRRHEKRLTYSTCLSEVESKQTSLGKLRAQIGSESKAYAAEMSLRRSQESADIAREDFCVVSQRVLREVDRFKRTKAEDMRRTVLDYINLQVEYNKRMEEVWSTLIPKLEQVQQYEVAVTTTTTHNNSNNNNIVMGGGQQQQQQQLQRHHNTVSPDASQQSGDFMQQQQQQQPPPYMTQQPPFHPQQQQQLQQPYMQQQPQQRGMPSIQQAHEIPQYDNATGNNNNNNNNMMGMGAGMGNSMMIGGGGGGGGIVGSMVGPPMAAPPASAPPLPSTMMGGGGGGGGGGIDPSSSMISVQYRENNSMGNSNMFG